MKPILFISRAGAAHRGAQLLALKECAFFRILPTRNLAANRSADCGFQLAMFNQAGLLQGFAMEALV